MVLSSVSLFNIQSIKPIQKVLLLKKEINLATCAFPHHLYTHPPTHPSIDPSIYPSSIHLSPHLSIGPSFIHQSTYSSILLFIHPSVYPSNHLLIYPCVHQFAHPSICPSITLCIHLYIHLHIHPSIGHSFLLLFMYESEVSYLSDYSVLSLLIS